MPHIYTMRLHKSCNFQTVHYRMLLIFTYNYNARVQDYIYAHCRLTGLFLGKSTPSSREASLILVCVLADVPFASAEDFIAVMDAAHAVGVGIIWDFSTNGALTSSYDEWGVNRPLITMHD